MARGKNIITFGLVEANNVFALSFILTNFGNHAVYIFQKSGPKSTLKY